MTDSAAPCRFCGLTREEHDPDERIDCPGGEGSRAIAQWHLAESPGGTRERATE